MQLSRRVFAGCAISGPFLASAAASPRVDAEEIVYDYKPADNGAGPLWDYGAPGLVRRGSTVYAAGLDTIPGVKPLHNCRWVLYKREANGWQRLIADEKERQREPCPIAIFEDGRLVISTNPTLAAPDAYNGPADPQLLTFATKDFHRPPIAVKMAFSGQPRLTEHTYRGMGADAKSGEILILHNDGRGLPNAHWATLGSGGEWLNKGVIAYPIRGCYPQVALRQRVAHVLAVGDIVEPVEEWRKWKFEQSGGRQWDYVFRRLFYTSNPDAAKSQFGELLEVANVDQTAGHITNLDLWLSQDGDAHLLYLKRSVASPAMRSRFFPGTPVTTSLEHCVVRNNQVTGQQTLLTSGDDAAKEFPVYARFHATPKGKLFVLASVRKTAFENRLIEILPGIRHGLSIPLPLKYPFTSFITATERGGSRPSDTIDVLGLCAGFPNTIRYARIRL